MAFFFLAHFPLMFCCLKLDQRRCFVKFSPNFAQVLLKLFYTYKLLLRQQETKTQDTIYGNDIEVLKNTLQIFGTYSISNATVRHVAEKHRIVPNEYQWNLHGRTPIEETEDDQLTLHNLSFNFTPLNDLEDAKEAKKNIILHVSPPRKTTSSKETTLMDVILIDKQCKFGIKLTNTTGTIVAKIFGVQAKNLFSITTKD
ncbi:replication protein A 70 kDa DNA-binding subunit D-like isoform X2 [Camellia sinensis]|uniref:replication protein A 70 kDa DNA-binding subunit D-like isoform X2 n=1 Tax=Camellia sinensis TaxID=4442 RepID=UPI0010357EE5|nr:replication protein A 70 kDa DNA-binding subunit D-like isoform X2 [Camellia sinensis]